tara:strand:- start:59 stop:313 length:255 start_codon:yes stop_codon:yes gene_type:complete
MQNKIWCSVKETLEELQIDRKQLFRMRDDGTCKLGTLYAAFPETRSRDNFRWNVPKMKKILKEQAKQDTEVISVSFGNSLVEAA